MSLARRFARCVLALALAAGGVAGLRVASPPDRVRVFVQGVPPGTRFACLVASGAEGHRCLDWSLTGVLGVPFTMHPADCIASYKEESDQTWLAREAYVRWAPAREYGVVVLGGDGVWGAAWFPAAEVSPGGLWGGRATFGCPGRYVSPVPQAVVRQLGLADVKAGP